MSKTTVRYARGVALGLAFLAVPMLVAWGASADRSLVGQLMPYGFLLTASWWIAVTMGVATAIGTARRATAGVIVGVASVVLFQVSMAMLQAPGERMQAFTSLGFWWVALATVAVPALIGMAFGWAMRQPGPSRFDGVRKDVGE